MSAALLAGEGLHSYYGTSHVLRGVDIAIAPGETLGLMGRNGMGKTTLVRTLLGLVRPSRGEVLVDGLRMTGQAPSRIARRGIGLVPEGRAIFANLTVKENLLLAARPGVDGSRAWTLERVLASFPRLAERLGSGGGQLSGGEQQMLAIGRALMTNPRLLILDEATEGLAPLVRQEIWRIVALVRDSGLAVLIVDKNVQHLATLADRFLVLVKGSVVFSGTPAALLADPELMHRHLGV
ncbi:MAG TPA: ABC transporter ATP-binding protein [Kiloniellales bacterium]|nr:ABC transporter ATP-binding protein [Kiloniellales bacterium]